MARPGDADLAPARTRDGAKPRPFMHRWREAVRESDLDSTAKLVAFALSTFMDAEGRTRRSRATIAAASSLNVRTVDEALRRLETAGLLEVLRNTGRHANFYLATLSEPNGEPDCTVDSNGEPDDSNGESDCTNS